MAALIFEFGEFKLDCGRFELSRNGRSLRIERKPLELLILLAQSNGQLVSREEIALRLWDSEVFVDTEHGINTAIRKIRLALRDDPEDPKFVQTVTGKGYRFIPPLVRPESRNGAAPAEIPAEPVRPVLADAPIPRPISVSAVVPPGQSTQPPHYRTWTIAILCASALLLIAAGVVVATRYLRSTQQPPIASLAVLPLDNLSGDSSQDYFADGMTDELITMLAKDSTLRIISRTSVMQYKRSHQPLQDIAHALGVDAIVEGSIARRGDQVHLTLQLIRAATDSHIWAESYDRDANDAALTDEAAQAIARRLQKSAAKAAPARYISPAAHDAFLHGRFLWMSAQDGQSGKYFQQAIDIQPDYAAAWAKLANYYGKAVVRNELDPRVALPLEVKAAQRALELDPNLADAHHAMSGAYLIARWDPVSADREILRAISLDPSDADFYYFRGNVLDAFHRYKEAIDLGKKAAELAPIEFAYAPASLYVAPREYDAALADLHMRLEASPDDIILLFIEKMVLSRNGDIRGEVAIAEKLAILWGDPRSANAIQKAWKEGGTRGYLRWCLAHSLEKAKTHYVSPVELAEYHARLGEKDQALTLLEEGFRQHSTDMLWIDEDPAYDFLHSDPRYRSLIQRIGLPQN
jgi:TolB-like protein/DNA-binding winged helix-turn-helix (wHTH) protein